MVKYERRFRADVDSKTGWIMRVLNDDRCKTYKLKGITDKN